MDVNEIVVTKKKITPDKEEEKRILTELNRARLKIIEGAEHPRILRKSELQNKDAIVIEHRNNQGFFVGVGLFAPKVDKEKNILTGISIYRVRGVYEFFEYTYYLNNYRRLWRAWTSMPKQGQPWQPWR